VSQSVEAAVSTYDWNAIVDDLSRLLRLKTTPIGMKLFTTVAEMEAIPKIRRPSSIHTTDQRRRRGWALPSGSRKRTWSVHSAVP